MIRSGLRTPRPAATLLVLGCLAVAIHGPAVHASEEGFVKTADGACLYYVKAGRGERAVILPARLFAFDGLSPLADEFTLISYDMRNRGRSSFVQDNGKLSIEDDVRDLEAIRSHFRAGKVSLIGYSYLGMMAVLYAAEHPERVERLVQMGPVPRKFGTEYPEGLSAPDNLDQEKVAELRALREKQIHLTDPEEYCRREWAVTRVRLVGDPSRAGILGDGPCEMPNEWPSSLARHFHHQFASIQALEITDRMLAEVRVGSPGDPRSAEGRSRDRRRPDR